MIPCAIFTGFSVGSFYLLATGAPGPSSNVQWGSLALLYALCAQFYWDRSRHV